MYKILWKWLTLRWAQQLIFLIHSFHLWDWAIVPLTPPLGQLKINPHVSSEQHRWRYYSLTIFSISEIILYSSTILLKLLTLYFKLTHFSLDYLSFCESFLLLTMFLYFGSICQVLVGSLVIITRIATSLVLYELTTRRVKFFCPRFGVLIVCWTTGTLSSCTMGTTLIWRDLLY